MVEKDDHAENWGKQSRRREQQRHSRSREEAHVAVAVSQGAVEETGQGGDGAES